ncbi:MAG TPA: GNAT family N-acetyltransferase [Acidimicrobiia bacterium]|nr:GNAT family N-acetyltransferase [Acidimicrobiia bacterium]
MTLEIRDATPGDLPIIKRVLYEAVGWDPGRRLPPLEVTVELPQLALYHHGWGRDGDIAVIAEMDGEVVGGALCRLFTDEEHGEGYYDEQTPELGVAVWGGRRGLGIGTRLIEELERRAAASGIQTMSLSVESANRARGLYERLGYETVAERDDDVLMVKTLSKEE